MTEARHILSSCGFVLLCILRLNSSLVISTSLRQFKFDATGICIEPHTFYVAGSEDRDEGTEGQTKEFSMRNVPGEGDCMFLAVAVATAASMGIRRDRDESLLREIAADARDVVARVLAAPGGNLSIEGARIVRARDLLASAAKKEGVTREAYLEHLRKGGNVGGLQGGGPELAVLSNVLRRPISIYELDEQQTADIGRCRIKLAGSFGDLFSDPCAHYPDSAVFYAKNPGDYSWHLHVLVLDLSSGEKHACALLPKFYA